MAGVLRVPEGSLKRLRGPTARLVLAEKQVPSLVEIHEGRQRQLVSIAPPVPTKGAGCWIPCRLRHQRAEERRDGGSSWLAVTDWPFVRAHSRSAMVRSPKNPSV